MFGAEEKVQAEGEGYPRRRSLEEAGFRIVLCVLLL